MFAAVDSCSCLDFLVFPYGSWFGSKLFQLLRELWKDIIDNRADDRPVGVLIVVNQPMSQSGNFHPRDGIVFLFELSGQVGHMFPDVVQGSGKRPLNGLLVKDSFGG